MYQSSTCALLFRYSTSTGTCTPQESFERLRRRRLQDTVFSTEGGKDVLQLIGNDSEQEPRWRPLRFPLWSASTTSTAPYMFSLVKISLRRSLFNAWNWIRLDSFFHLIFCPGARKHETNIRASIQGLAALVPAQCSDLLKFICFPSRRGSLTIS